MATRKSKKKPRMTKPRASSSQIGKYRYALWKWLKVVFWYYEDMSERLAAMEKRLVKIEKTAKFIKERLESNR